MLDHSVNIAFIHDWLATWGGGEQVLEAALEVYAPAPIHTLVYKPEIFTGTLISQQEVHTSFIQRLPGSRGNHRIYLPLMPLAIEQFDVGGYEVILSDSHAVAHGVIPSAEQMHINYIHVPARYAWHLHQEYLRDAVLERGLRSWMTRVIMHYIRLWDLGAANRVDHFVANSGWTARNVWRAYRRHAEVIYPPVDVDHFQPLNPREDYYITIARLVPYKRIDLIVEAFSNLPYPLRIVGTGPDIKRLMKHASSNIEFMGWQSDDDLRELLGRAKAFVYAAVEDFGITPVEAQAAGCPVIAYGKGGVCETVLHGRTGILYQEQTSMSLATAIREFEGAGTHFSPTEICENAGRFNKERFKRELSEFIERKWSEFQDIGEGRNQPGNRV
jgi:glycosyltransferase involved in cell wall biosynthesis